MTVGALIVCSGTLMAADGRKAKTEIQQEISIKAEGASGPPVSVPGPRADKEVIGEVVRSLDLYTSDHKSAEAGLTVPAGSRRLNRPFPEPPYLVFQPQAVAAPYDSWIFEVVSGAEVVWRTEGAGRVKEPIEWDGSGSAGDTAARVEKPYRFRFTGKNGPGQFAVESAPLALKSMAYTEYLGETRLEVANSALFSQGSASFSAGALEYLEAMGDRLRRADIRDQPYHFLLFARDPKAALALSRARKLRYYFAKYLLITPKRVEVEILRPADRGDCTVCVLPAEKGAVIRSE